MDRKFETGDPFSFTEGVRTPIVNKLDMDLDVLCAYQQAQCLMVVPIGRIAVAGTCHGQAAGRKGAMY